MLIQGTFKSKPINTLSWQKWMKGGWGMASLGKSGHQIGEPQRAQRGKI
jgi:hypothetical protein